MDTANRQRSLFVILVAIAVCGVGWGLSMPLFALLMKAMGASSSLIGFNTAVPALSALAVTPVLPSLMRRFGIRRVLLTCLLCLIAFISMMPLVDAMWLWFPLRFVFGMAIAGMFVATEIWINLIAEDHNRGRIIGLYGTGLAGGFALGTLTLATLGSAGWPPVVAGAGIFALATGLLTVVRPQVPTLEPTEDPSLLPYMVAAPTVMAAGIVFGAVEMGIFTLLPVYGLQAGLAENASTGLLVAVAAGNVALQVPLGMLADRINKRAVLGLCGGAGLVGALAVPVLLDHPIALYSTLFVMGGVIVGLYTISLVIIGDRLRGNDVAGANAAFIMMYGVGSLFGPLAAGPAMDVWRPHGLMAVLGGLSLAFLVVLLARTGRRHPRRIVEP
ncbi:MAG: MFS transporter [Alphaproteobacteria bacterium]